MHGLDKLRVASLIPERPAYLAHDHRQDRLMDRGFGPDGLQQGVFRHELPGVRHQTPQDGKSFGAEPYGFVLLPQTLIPQVQQEGVEAKTLRLWHRALSTLSGML